MAPLLRTYFNPSHRSFLSTLFTATFLGAVVVVAFPCPVRPGDRSRPQARLEDGETLHRTSADSGGGGATDRWGKRRDEVVVMMNERGKRRFMEES